MHRPKLFTVDIQAQVVDSVHKETNIKSHEN